MNIDTSLLLSNMDENSTGQILLLTQLSRLVSRRSTPELLGQTLKELAALSFLRDFDEKTQQTLEDEILVALNAEERATLAHLQRKALDGHNMVAQAHETVFS